MSRRIAIEQKGMRLGWRTPRDGRLKLAKLHKNSECAKGHKKNFIFYYVTVSLYVQLLPGP